MSRSSAIDRALRDALDLCIVARATTDRVQRDGLERIAQRRIEDAGPTVPKVRAARLLGVSVTAIDNWIQHGAIRALRRSASRQELETEPLIELAGEVARLRADGRERGVLAAALRNLGLTAAEQSQSDRHTRVLPRPGARAIARGDKPDGG